LSKMRKGRQQKKSSQNPGVKKVKLGEEQKERNDRKKLKLKGGRYLGWEKVDEK